MHIKTSFKEEKKKKSNLVEEDIPNEYFFLYLVSKQT